jgi:mycofactocin biosynthesis protein MftB
VTFDPTLGYRLHANVALRPEPFGALAYHYGNRKLVFLKSPRMVTLVKSLGDYETVEAALAPLNLSPKARDNYLGALASLYTSDMLVPQTETTPDTPSNSQENVNATVG